MGSRLGACWVGGVSTPGTAQSTNYCCCHIFLLRHCSNANAPFCIHSWRVPPAVGQLWVKIVVQRVRLQAVQVHSNNCSQIKVFPYLCMYSWGAQKVGNNLAHFMQIMPALHFFWHFRHVNSSKPDNKFSKWVKNLSHITTKALIYPEPSYGKVFRDETLNWNRFVEQSVDYNGLIDWLNDPNECWHLQIFQAFHHTTWNLHLRFRIWIWQATEPCPNYGFLLTSGARLTRRSAQITRS